MSAEAMNQQSSTSFYRNHSSSSPYRTGRNIQNLSYYQQTNHYNNKRYNVYNNNSNHMNGTHSSNGLGNYNFGSGGPIHGHHGMSASNAGQLHGAQTNGLNIHCLPIDINLEDLQNEANNRSDESEFGVSSDENTLDFLDAEFQDLQVIYLRGGIFLAYIELK